MLTPYNLQPYNLPYDDNRFTYVITEFNATVMGVIGLGHETDLYSEFNCDVKSDVDILIGPMVALEFDCNILSGSTLYLVSHAKTELECNVMTASALGAEYSIKDEFECNVVAVTAMGGKYSIFTEYECRILGDIALGTKRFMSVELSCFVLGQLDIAVLQEDIGIINVTIPPGSELRIDSNNYTCTLDGNNIIDKYSDESDWIMISRKTLSIDVDTGTSADIEGKILFTELWL